MGFDNRYTSETKKNDSRYLVPDEKSCILPFFGFQYKKEESSQTKLVGGELTLSAKSNGDYEVRRAPSFYDTDRYTYAEFSRKQSPNGKEKELEDRFYELIENDSRFQSRDVLGFKHFDPLKTGYLCKSVQEYYEQGRKRAAGTRKKSTVILLTVAIIVLLDIILTLLLSGFENENIVFGVFWGIVGVVVAGLLIWKKIKANRNWYSLTEEQKIQQQQVYMTQYFNSYGREAGSILREYAKLKGYDKI